MSEIQSLKYQLSSVVAVLTDANNKITNQTNLVCSQESQKAVYKAKLLASTTQVLTAEKELRKLTELIKTSNNKSKSPS